jgi:hypothetical protein
MSRSRGVTTSPPRVKDVGAPCATSPAKTAAAVTDSTPTKADRTGLTYWSEPGFPPRPAALDIATGQWSTASDDEIDEEEAREIARSFGLDLDARAR